jgi:hypothetical protein
VEHDIVAVGDDRGVIVMQLFRRSLDKFEEPLAPRRDMSTVLDIGGRPETLRRGVVPLIEERVERLQDERFLLCLAVAMALHLLVRKN